MYWRLTLKFIDWTNWNLISWSCVWSRPEWDWEWQIFYILAALGMYDVALCMNADSNTDTGHLTLLFIYTPRLLQTVVFIARERELCCSWFYTPRLVLYRRLYLSQKREWENFAVLSFILPACTDDCKKEEYLFELYALNGRGFFPLWRLEVEILLATKSCSFRFCHRLWLALFARLTCLAPSLLVFHGYLT